MVIYVSINDGGLANDPRENGQKEKKSLLGKMLQLDTDSGSPYKVFLQRIHLLAILIGYQKYGHWYTEILGVSFDEQTGVVLLTDMGQNLWEEVDFVPAGSAGGNEFSWDCWKAIMF
ncbi:MAG: hypothetical protein IPF63_11480 [Bacteroidetes bacterium]|nr:hypothetical protein [Bacteroidota bacterium]